MITPKTQYNLRNAKVYFQEHLAHGDYYSEKHTIAGQWFGLGAEKLGLGGTVSERDFLAMCDGKNPVDGERLTARHNTVRNVGGIEQANRRVFFDFVFRPPKSVSLVALCHDARIIALHNEAVRESLVELERFAATRVRRFGADTQRTTGNLAAALFCHDASRALDPLLHTHAVVFNATFDAVEARWKALANSDMLKAQKLANAVYDARLTGGLARLGYQIRREGQSYEIDTVARPTIEKFSKRRQQIVAVSEAQRAKLGETANIFAIRDQVAHEHRARKVRNANASTLREMWMGEMTVAERHALEPTGVRPPVDRRVALAEGTRIADGILFERKSVVTRYELEAAILHETLGSGATLAEVRPVVDSERYLRDIDTSDVTSEASLRAEMDVFTAARAGRDMLDSINGRYDVAKTGLDVEQQTAARTILESRDFITLFRGAAGTGKSYTLREVAAGVTAAGKALVVVAPGTGQVVSLQEDGRPAPTLASLLPAQTLASLLTVRQVPTGAVILVDEAGQIGARQMRELFEMAKAAGARLVLSGDTRQHGAVEASDALRAIEKFSGLQAAEIKTIRRQDPRRAESAAEAAQIEAYRKAVFAASEGDIGVSLVRLEKLGAIVEVLEDERQAAVARAVVSELALGVDVLAVTQTRAEAAAVNEAVTAACVARGLVQNAVEVEIFVPRDLAAIEKTLGRNYAVGDEIRFVTGYNAHKVGSVRKVVHVTADALLLEPNGDEFKAARVSLRYAEKWNLVDRRKVVLGEGSRVQLKLNGESAEGHRLVNGELCVVRRQLKDGRLVVQDGQGAIKTLGLNQRVLLPGYCVTSYSAQGKTVDAVILSDSGSRLATNEKQWYVSISRARKRIKIFTHDVEDLADRIQVKGEERLAAELQTRPRKERPIRHALTPAQRLRVARRLGARLGRKLAAIIKQQGEKLWRHKV